MADFIVAMTSDGSSSALSQGQALTPNVAGPNGSGSPGSATAVNLISFTVAFGDSDTDLWPLRAYLYDTLPTVGQLNNDGLYALRYSTSYVDGSAFGTGTYTRTYTFGEPINIDPTQLHYVLLSSSAYMMYATTSLYSGGKRYNQLLAAQTNSDLQFSAEFEIA